MKCLKYCDDFGQEEKEKEEQEVETMEPESDETRVSRSHL